MTAQTDSGFNPDATLEIPEANLGNFGDLIAGGDAGDDQQAAAINNELKSSTFGSLDIKDFSDFNAQDVVPDDGTYVFSVEQKFLKEATAVTRLTTAARGTFGVTKVTLFRDKLRLSTFNQTAFSEMLIPLHEKTPSLADGQEISFIFDHAVLSKIANTFVDAIVSFQFIAEKHLLIITSGKTKLELSTFNKTDFTDYHAKLGSPEYKAQINPLTLRRGIQYAGTFVKKDDIQLNLSLIDVRDGQVLGGSYSAIGIYQAKALADQNVRIKYEVIQILDKILGKFHETNTHLFETDNYYILRDENLYLGFEKTEFSFPPVKAFLDIKATDHILVPRSNLLNALYKLSVVSVDRDLLVNIKLEGLGAQAVATLVTKDASGKESQDVLQVFRQAANGVDPASLEPWDININILAFIKIASHFESANVHLELLSGKAVAIKDSGDDFDATTILSLLNADQVAAVKAQRENVKA